MGSTCKPGHHWAAKCKVDFSKEFERKGIPLETTQDELNKRELNNLERFFNMEETDGLAEGSTDEPEGLDGLTAEAVQALQGLQGTPEECKAAEVDEMVSAAWIGRKWSSAARAGRVSFVEARHASRQSRQGATSFATVNASDVVEIDRRSIIASGFGGKALHRVHQPITFRELVEARAPVPMFLSDFEPITPRAEPRPQETHYEYFARRLPGERPESRLAIAWKMETTRRVIRSGLPGASASPRWGEQVRSRAGTTSASRSTPASPSPSTVLPAGGERPSTTPGR